MIGFSGFGNEEKMGTAYQSRRAMHTHNHGVQRHMLPGMRAVKTLNEAPRAFQNAGPARRPATKDKTHDRF
jgi:hypothetical protein